MEGIGVRFIGVSLFVCGDVETFHHDAGFLAAGVGVAQFGGDAPFLAGHQGDVAIAVDGGEDAVAGLGAHGFQTHQEGWVFGRVGDGGGEEPAVAAPVGGRRHVDGDFGERAQRTVVFFFDTAPVEVLGDQFLALAKFQADEMDGREAGGVLHLEGRGHGIFGAIEGGGLFPFHGAIGIEDPDAGGERGRGAGAVVDYFDVVAGGVPLDVQGLGALFGAEVGGGGLEVVVVRLPDEGRPAGMAHPDEQAHAVLTLRLEHGAVVLVIFELGEPEPIGHIGGGAITLFDARTEVGGVLRALVGEVVHTPDGALGRPHGGCRHHETQAIEGDDIGHAHLAMHERGGALREIVFGGLFGVGAVAADDAVGRAGDVVYARMGGGEGGADAVVDGLGRVALVAADVDAYRGMAAYAEHVVLNVAQEHGIVVGIGAIPGIGQPEILPDDDAVAVAGFVELVLADLAHPVADHVEIHFRVIAHGGVVFAGAVAQHAFAEAPTAALGNEAAAVDPHFERAAFFAVSELTDARLELFGVGNGVGGGFELQAHVVEIGRAVSGGPPQLRVDELQGVLDALAMGGGAGDGGFASLGAEASAQRAGHGGGGMIQIGR